jgi:cell division protein FtsB
MPAPLQPSAAPRAETESAQPRRKRAQLPAAAGSSRRRSILNSLLIFAAGVLLVDALVGDKGLMERLRARRQLQQAEASLASIRQENAQMREYVRRLNEDSTLIELLAREELGLIRPGEVLFIIKEAERPAAN